jgi:hypothetical protein
VSALDAAVDAGINAASSGAAPLPTGHDWFAPAIMAAIVGAVGSVLLFFLNKWSQDRLEALKSSMADGLAQRTERLRSDLTAAVTDRTERLRHELTDDLAKRTRRADYIRGQIDQLYGPLAFFVEASARCIETEHSIGAGYREYFAGRTAITEESRTKLQLEAHGVIGTSSRYMDLVVENNQEAVKVLRTGWGWLDADDVADAGQYLTDVARYKIEVEENHRLPDPFYLEGAMKSAIGPPSFIRPAFIARVRRKLLEKQLELAGLTGAAQTTPAPPPG